MGVTIDDATPTSDGAESAADKAKLDSLAPGVVAVTGAAPIVSSGGLNPNISIAPATESAAGSMSAADKIKLDGIAAGAAVASVAALAPLASSGGASPNISISTATELAAGIMSAVDKIKLDGLGFLSVMAFGAKGDGVTDDTAAIQATIDASAASPLFAGQYPTILLPAGKKFLITKPLRMRTNGQVLLGGDGTAQAHLLMSAGGPMIILAPSGYAAIPLVPWPLGGNAVKFPDGHTQYFNLRMDGSNLGDLNGLAQFDAEIWIQPNTIAAGIQAMFGSSGVRNVTGSATQAFLIYQSGQTINAKLNVGGTLYSLSSGNVLSVGVQYHVALSYDGAMIRLFLNGILQVSQPATGTIVQSDFEDLTIGQATNAWPDAGLLFNGFTGLFGQMGTYNTALRTANFTPPTNLPGGANCMMLVQWSNNTDICTRVISGLGDSFWAVIRTQGVGNENNVSIRHLTLDPSGTSNGIYVFGSHNWILDDVSWLGGINSMIGILCWNNAFDGHLKDCQIGSARINLCISAAGGIIKADKITLTGGRYQLVVQNGSLLLDQPNFAVSSSTAWCITALGINTQIVASHAPLDVEIAPPNAFNGTVYASVSGGALLTFVGGDFTSMAHQPTIWIDKCDSLVIVGASFTTSGEAEVIHFANRPTMPACLIGVQQRYGTIVPWTADMTMLWQSGNVYAPATPSNWVSPPPNKLQDAIDRIAAAVVTLRAPIP